MGDISVYKNSYANKDFGAIYPELLDIAKNLTNVWDPSTSNESDPGVVLLKEAAFTADHINYNTDKNILEAFLPTATQESTVRMLAEINGYIPSYYVSATGQISFTYDMSKLPSGTTGFRVDPFTYTISNGDNSTIYTQAEALYISSNGKGSCKFIEGYKNDLEIDGNNLIILDNINEDRRIYLPKSNIAINGVYINNVGYSGYWTRVEYLNIYPRGSYIYKLDYDSNKQCVYVEFPTDINDLIGDGLNISYIVTSGSLGNVAAKSLDTIIEPAQYTVNSLTIESTNFTVSNLSNIDNGKDPEDIDEIYSNFKHVVNTFDTLVSCKDFSNAVRNIVDQLNNKVVSNAVVTDSTNDYNGAIDIITYDKNGEYFVPGNLGNGIINYEFVDSPSKPGDIYVDSGKLYLYVDSANSVEIKDFRTLARLSETLSNNDLKLCALTAYNPGLYTNTSYSKALEQSYQPLDNNSTQIKNIKETLADYKCISTDFKDKHDNELYYFLVKEPLKIQVTTYDKIYLPAEFTEIKNNIYKAISENFNASLVEFGEDLDLDKIYDVIINADNRIKNIYLDIDYDKVDVKGIIKGENEPIGLDDQYKYVADEENYTLLVDLISKNVLAGRLCLFEFNKAFKYNYGQKDNELVRDIEKIRTELDLTGISEGDNYKYTLDKTNHYIKVAWPKYNPDVTYPGLCYYIFESNNLGAKIPKETDYMLKTGETLYLAYKSTDSYITDKYEAGRVIRSSFEVKEGQGTFIVEGSQKKYNQIPVSDTIIIEGLLETELSKNIYNLYWIRNNSDDKLFSYNKSNNTITPTGNTYEEIINDITYISTILGTNEYFIYTDMNKESLIILGAGTKVSFPESLTESGEIFENDNIWALDKNSRISIDQIALNGLSAEIPFKETTLDTDGLHLNEMNLLTLSKNDSIVCNKERLESKWDSAKNITYQLNGADPVSLPTDSIFNYMIKSELVITNDQKFSEAAGEYLIINDDEEHSITNTCIQSALSLAGVGSDNVITSIGDKKLTVMKYQEINPIAEVEGEEITLAPNLPQLTQGLKSEQNGNWLSVPFRYERNATAPEPGYSYIIPVLFNGINENDIDNIKIKIGYYDSDAPYLLGEVLEIFNFGDSSKVEELPLSKDKYIYLVSFDPLSESENLVMNITWDSIPQDSSVTLLPLKSFKGINQYLGINDDIDTISTYMKVLVDSSTAKGTDIYYINEPDNSIAIQDPRVKINGKINLDFFFDKNNIANIMTIPMIDLDEDKTEITLTKSVKGYRE